jgi:predicted RNA-binding Zn ribbon-like protein
MEESTSVLLTDLAGESFRFDPGAASLRWALSGGEDYRAAYEKLHGPDDLRRWTTASIAVDVDRVTSRDLAEAKSLREAIWQCADARADGRPLPREPSAEINRLASRPPLIPQIRGRDRRGWAEPITCRQVLSTMARDAIELFTGSTANRIRRCAGTNCSLIFVDTSRPGRRRWCSMERCGNRAKVNAFRSRATKEGAQ